ncbi:MAG: spore cortex biosynthesis protein YabQ [Faecalibacterium sp.]|nr:spore cortex biosynthesis protein YabQ [Ruminococcus sp.]MCM1392796.1 spore cortex biosynthesis protein YabQ [Ruminococcus sp.]MCM1485528.1 spore cortex biosynthesis protein YabQ [Faecalibacterium sp.]
MKYGLTISDQLSHFLFAVGFGFILGIFYRLTASVRKAVSGKKAAYVACDIFFCVVSTILCFTFMLVYSNGEVRIELIAAIAIGAAIYFMTSDKFVRSMIEPLIRVLKKLVLLICKPFKMLMSIFVKTKSRVKSKAELIKEKAKSKHKKKEKTVEDEFETKNNKITNKKKSAVFRYHIKKNSK